MTGHALLFPGPSGALASAAVQTALAAGVNANAALLFGRICSFNGRPSWELRGNLCALFGVCKRSITRWWAELVEAGLICNKPAPLGTLLPGCTKPLPYRPWLKWAIGLPALREAIREGSREAYQRWAERFERERQGRATRAKLGSIIGQAVGGVEVPMKRPARPKTEPKRWTADELDAAITASVGKHQLDVVESTGPPGDQD